MNKEIRWFRYHVVNENLVSSENCDAVEEAILEADMDLDLQTFAQAIVDNELCADVERLPQIVEMSVEEARSLGMPPEDADEKTPEPQETQEDQEEPPRETAGVTATADDLPEPATPDREVEVQAGEEWTLGWPDLSQVEEGTPEKNRMVLNAFLEYARKNNCSDVHISAAAKPFVRRYKTVHLLADQKVVSRETAKLVNISVLDDLNRAKFEETKDLDYCYAADEQDRYRTNVMHHRLGVAGSYRVIDHECKDLEDLGFQKHDVIRKLTTYSQGLILVTGPVGCGKSTTLASLVDLINETRRDHVITVEDPIEVIHQPKHCNITQRELHTHTKSFANALRAALREDPDIIVIGELRDLDTIEMAIRAAETGHLVIGTLHTGSAPSTMDRMLDVFPANQQGQIRSMTAESLKGVICQQLLPNKNTDGLALAAEIMLGTIAVANLIREGKTHQLNSIIQTGKNLGMSTMEQSYFDLYMAGQRSYEQTFPLIESSDLIREIQKNEAQAVKGGAKPDGNGKKKKKWF